MMCFSILGLFFTSTSTTPSLAQKWKTKKQDLYIIITSTVQCYVPTLCEYWNVLYKFPFLQSFIHSADFLFRLSHSNCTSIILLQIFLTSHFKTSIRLHVVINDHTFWKIYHSFLSFFFPNAGTGTLFTTA